MFNLYLIRSFLSHFIEIRINENKPAVYVKEYIELVLKYLWYFKIKMKVV